MTINFGSFQIPFWDSNDKVGGVGAGAGVHSSLRLVAVTLLVFDDSLLKPSFTSIGVRVVDQIEPDFRAAANGSCEGVFIEKLEEAE